MVTPYDRADVRLADTDDPFSYGMYFVVIHVLLLLIHFVNHSKTFCLFLCQSALRFQKLINVFSVPTDILELLFDCLTDLLVSTFFTLSQIQVIFSGILAVHPWCVVIKPSTEVINDPFQIFPCRIQKIYILWKRNVLGNTGRIQDQCPGIFIPLCLCMIGTAPARSGSSGVLCAIIISLISPKMSSVRRLRNSTRSEGTMEPESDSPAGQ